MKFNYKVKKVICLILIVSSLSLFGCRPKKQEGKVNNDFDMKIAMNIVETYMNYLIEGDVGNIKTMYSNKLSKQGVENKNSQDLKIKGYTIDETNNVGKSGIFSVKTVSINSQNPYTCIEEYRIKVIKEDNQYKIDAININMDKEAFLEKNKIRYRNKNEIKTELILDSSGIPDFSYAKDDKANVKKIDIPKKHIGTMSFAYNENLIAISTYDENNVFAGVVTIDESKAVQGEADEGDQGQAPKGGEQSQEGMNKPTEKPIGKEVLSLDILKASKIDFMVFSPDEKFIVLQYETSDKSKNIRIYKSDSGEIIPIKFEDKYPLDKVNVKFSSFNRNSVNFDIRSKEENNKEVSKFIGKWQLNLDDFKLKKL